MLRQRDAACVPLGLDVLACYALVLRQRDACVPLGLDVLTCYALVLRQRDVCMQLGLIECREAAVRFRARS